MRSSRQLVAADGNGFGFDLAGLWRRRFATNCYRLQPRGSIRAPSSVVDFGDTSSACRVIGFEPIDFWRGRADGINRRELWVVVVVAECVGLTRYFGVPRLVGAVSCGAGRRSWPE
jgi:hypothetical protein